MRNNIQEHKAAGLQKWFLLHKIADILCFQMRFAPIYNVNGNLKYGRIDAQLHVVAVATYTSYNYQEQMSNSFHYEFFSCSSFHFHDMKKHTTVADVYFR